MIENETWALGSAMAKIVRWAGSTMVHVDGVVTAQAYEALHLRLSRERAAQQVFVMLDWEALLAATNRSAVEAAVRGAAAVRPQAKVSFLVPAARLRWAQRHCELMSEHGISCSAKSLPAQVRQLERQSLAA